MATRTNAQLNSDFPVDTLGHYQASAAKFDFLQRDGQLRTDEIDQVLDQFGGYMDPLYNAHDVAAPTGSFTGTAGTTTRKYVAIPNYPIADPAGKIPTTKNLPGKPPYGRPDPTMNLQDVLGSEYRTRRFIGGTNANTAITGAELTLSNTAAALDAADYCTITAPAAVAAVAASGTITIAGASTTGQTLSATINGTTVTINQTTGNTATQDAAALVTAIQGNATLNALVAASNAAGVVTVTAKTAGVAGNAITLAAASSGGDTVAVSGAKLTGGYQQTPGLLYDIVDVSGSTWLLVATNVAPGGIVTDKGVGAGVFADKDLGAGIGKYHATYTLYAHTEVAVDTADGSFVTAPNTAYKGLSN